VSAVDLAAVLCAVLALVAAGALTLAAARMFRAAQGLAEARERFDAEATPAVAELREIVASAGDEVERIDELLTVAGTIGDRVDAATEVTYRALTSPVIKGVALATGTRRVARRLRGELEDTDQPGIRESRPISRAR